MDKVYQEAINKRRINKTVYYGSLAFISVVKRALLDVEVKKESPLPESSAILAFNHCLKFDPFLLTSCVDKPVHFWVQYEGIYNDFLKRNYLNATGGIPVRTERTDYRKNLRELFNTTRWWLDNSQDYIGIFTDSEMKDVCTEVSNRDHYPGAAYLALSSRTPIVPVSIWAPKKIVKESKDVKRSVFSNFMFILKNRKIPIRIGFGEPLEPRGNKLDLANLVHQEQARIYSQIRRD